MASLLDPRIKLRHLQAFVEVARQKSVMRAADSLHISQPAVTKTVRELEDVLGVALFEREGRGIRQTRLGDIFLRHASATMAALRQAVDAVSREAAQTDPPVRIGALPTVSARIMPDAMTRFLGDVTQAPVKIVTGENAILLEQLRQGDLDLVVGRLAAPEKMTGLSFEHLYSERVVFVVRPDHGLLSHKADLFTELSNYPMLMPTRNSVIRPIVDQFLISQGVVMPRTQIETVSDSFGRAYVRMSDAVWIISEGVVVGDVEAGALAVLPFDTSDTSGPVGLTMRTDTAASTSLALMIDAIRKASAIARAP
ncbi:LysR family pca operon transcriptional activator [Agrobacterium larrymoorei]|uniref:HTH-type transcriptional regulator TtuA n=1 Tax=Agrobacterium larrymoorei TaxID=160699 RepID=A0AAJ2ERF9_9HYPH|nr:pca operon transcription factor PcaQ [Agrobacterium larrymoorei]MDR6100388.1 LysR family pca operon transcriptional activator [Agrobacterium larrymoorei]